jgi:hypothetical protein
MNKLREEEEKERSRGPRTQAELRVAH